MPFDFTENEQNSIDNPPNNAFYFGPQQIYQAPGYPIPYPSPNHTIAIPAQNQIYPVQFVPQNKPPIRPYHPKHDLNDHSYSRKPSPMKTPIPAKRHRFNESGSNDSDCIKSDSSSSDNSNSDSFTGIEIDSLFYEFQCFAAEASLFSENVAKNYRKRPCFKKIELLLSRLRQELNVHHNIVSNINSQGTAWAIKDFIFVFSRIVNAWIIMRGYFYDKSSGLDDLRQEFHSGLNDCFFEWQESTVKMMKTLMSTIENIDVMTQHKSGNKHKKKEHYGDVDLDVKQYDKDFLDNFQKQLFSPKFVENSEEIQMRNHQSHSYFRAGILKPLKIVSMNDSPTNSSSPITPTTPKTDLLNWISYEDLNDTDSPFQLSNGHGSERLYNRKSCSLPVTPLDHEHKFEVQDKSRAKKDLSLKFNNIQVYSHDIEAELEKQFGNLDMKLDDCEVDEEKFMKMYKEDGHKVGYLLNEVSKISCVENFTVCINMIIENVRNGKYANFDTILDEFNVLVKHAYGLIDNSRKSDDKIAMKKFVGSLEAIINRKAFE